VPYAQLIYKRIKSTATIPCFLGFFRFLSRIQISLKAPICSPKISQIMSVRLAVVAAALVSAYLLLRPPGEVNDGPASPHAIDQSSSQ
jgi:hypothetical protein